LARKITSAGGGVNGSFGLAIFDNASMDRIHAATLDVLANEGIKTNCKEALEIYSAGGCEADKNEGRVRIPARIVEAAIDSAPESILFAARDPENDFVMEGSRVHFCNFSKGVNVIDAFTGVYRESRLEDQKNVAILVDALSEYDLLDVAVETRDVPDAIANILSYEAMAANCSKHSGQSAHGRREAEIMIEMAAVIAGGKEKLRERPICSCVVCPTSPLTISNETTEPIIAYAENGVPCTVLSMVMAGSTAPVTLAGTLVVHNAEVLSGIVLGQLTKKGAPNLYGSSSTILDLRTAAVSVGCPELAMLGAAVAKLAQYYKIPSYLAGG